MGGKLPLPVSSCRRRPDYGPDKKYVDVANVRYHASDIDKQAGSIIGEINYFDLNLNYRL